MNLNRAYKALLLTVTRLPKATIAIGEPDYSAFTRWHRKIPWIANKQFPALINTDYPFEGFFNTHNGKNSLRYFARKAERVGYDFKPIDRNLHLKDMDEINQSLAYRCGKKMATEYFKATKEYEKPAFGVFLDEKLVAYVELSLHRDIAVINRILGHGDHRKAGIMYLLMLGIITELWGEYSWIMYDSMLFNNEGLKLFKKRCGFKSWRVRWLKES